jgi:serine/threonine protein kinase
MSRTPLKLCSQNTNFVIKKQCHDLIVALSIYVNGFSNIFSLGVIVYEMTPGNRPFLGESLAIISNRIF